MLELEKQPSLERSPCQTLTIGPPARKARGEPAFKKSAGAVSEQEHNSLSSVIRDGASRKLGDLASTRFLAAYVRVNKFICRLFGNKECFKPRPLRLVSVPPQNLSSHHLGHSREWGKRFQGEEDIMVFIPHV